MRAPGSRGTARAAAALASVCLASCGGEDVDFSGTWEGVLTPSRWSGPLLLQQQGQDVAGTLGVMALVGRVDGRTLSFSLTYGSTFCSGAATGSATVVRLADRDRMQLSYFGADSCNGTFNASGWFDRLRCPGGMLACSGGYYDDWPPYCANGQTDSSNCGHCGVKCGVSQACKGGLCQVPACDGPVRLQSSLDTWVAMTLSPLALSDVDSDGATDAVALDLDFQRLAVLPGNGRGGFGTAVKTSLSASPISMAIGDLDRDGRPDAVVYQVDHDLPSGAIQVLLGNGDGSFRTGQSLPAGETTYPGPRVLALADLDGDGVLDLAARSGNPPAVQVRPGLGDGTFGQAHEYALPGPLQSLAAADLDGDGSVDLAVSYFRLEPPGPPAGGPGMSVLLGTGDGTFRNPIDLPGLGFPRDLAVGDFDRDGIPDLVGTTWDSVAEVLLGNGDGTFAAPVRVGPVPACGYYSLAVADLDGDGDQDVVAANCGGLEVILGLGDGTFERSVEYPLPLGALAVAAGDLDGDGRMDLAVASREWSMSAFLACPP